LRFGIARWKKFELTEEQSTAVFPHLPGNADQHLRHAQATRVDIKLKKDDNYFVCRSADDGKGITEQRSQSSNRWESWECAERAYPSEVR